MKRFFSALSSQFVHLVIVCALVLFCAVSGRAQNSADGSTPLALSPGAPEGSYSLSGFDNVNLFNGSLNFALPLYKIGGRGQTGYPIMLRLDQKWLIEKELLSDPPPSRFLYYPSAAWWNETGFQNLYSMGKVDMRQAISKDHSETLTRLTFTAPDGTEYELRDVLTNGQPKPVGTFNRGRVFTSTDGSVVS